MGKYKLITSANQNTVSVGVTQGAGIHQKILDKVNVTGSFHDCITILFGKEPRTIYNKNGDMFEVTVTKKPRPISYYRSIGKDI